MKKLLLATVALVALGATVPALAADLSARAPAYTKAPVYAAPIYNWTGFYIGGHLGGAFGGDNSLTGTDGRFLGGIQGGADYEFGNNWVIGAEAQYSWLGSNNTGLLFPSGTVVTSNSDQLRSARLLLWPDIALRQGRLCLEGRRQYQRRFCRWTGSLHHRQQP